MLPLISIYALLATFYLIAPSLPDIQHTHYLNRKQSNQALRHLLERPSNSGVLIDIEQYRPRCLQALGTLVQEYRRPNRGEDLAHPLRGRRVKGNSALRAMTTTSAMARREAQRQVRNLNLKSRLANRLVPRVILECRRRSM